MPHTAALQAIETAIQIEEEGFAFYSEAAERVTDAKGKEMFLSLARDEVAHRQIFETARRSLLDRGEWLSPEEVAAIAPERRPPIFPTGEAASEVEVPAYELAALRRGIQAEEDSIAFYTEQMEGTDDAQARAMYAYLVEQEEGHRTILQGEYDYLTRTGFWFDVREFDLEAPG